MSFGTPSGSYLFATTAATATGNHVSRCLRVFLRLVVKIPFLSLFHKRGLHFSKFVKIPGRLSLGVVAADTPLSFLFARRSLLPSRLLASLTPHENIYTVPNILTFSRLIAAPVVGYFIIQEQHLSALGLFVYAAITDLVDGWIARNWGLQTVVGSVIDPMADKMLMTTVTICLAVKAAIPGMFLVHTGNKKGLSGLTSSFGKSTVSLAAVILGRDAILGLVAIYIRYISLPAPKTFVRYWDFSLPSAEVRPTGISKINTALQLALVGWTMTGMAIGGDLGIWGEDGALRVMW